MVWPFLRSFFEFRNYDVDTNIYLVYDEGN